MYIMFTLFNDILTSRHISCFRGETITNKSKLLGYWFLFAGLPLKQRNKVKSRRNSHWKRGRGFSEVDDGKAISYVSIQGPEWCNMNYWVFHDHIPGNESIILVCVHWCIFIFCVIKMKWCDISRRTLWIFMLKALYIKNIQFFLH